jgi:anti-sigma factor RsiW
MADTQRETTALLRAACAEYVYAGGPQAYAMEPIRRSTPKRAFAYAIAASIAALAFGFAGGALWSPWSKSDHNGFLDEVAEYHEVFSHETRHLAEVLPDQADHIKAWLGNRLDRKIAIPDLESAGLTFAGARMLVIDGKPVADLLYTRKDGLPIAFCILRNDGKAGPVQMERRGDLKLAYWNDGGYAFVVTGDIEKNMLTDITQKIRGQISG